MQLEANYSLDPALPQPDQNWELRSWISETIPKITTPNTFQNNGSGGTSATITITSIPYFGTPISANAQNPTIISGVMNGEPSRFPFDKYSASIGTQNDFNSAIKTELPFCFTIQTNINGYKFNAISGGSNTVIITLARTWVSEWLIPFVPLLILLIYASWVLYCSFWRMADNLMTLVSNVALFLSILSLRAFVVPNGIPFGCVFDLALIIPLAIILFGIIRIMQFQITEGTK